MNDHQSDPGAIVRDAAHEGAGADGVFIVVPAFNEATRIGPVVAGLRARYGSVVVIDDGSADDTFKVARAAGATALRHAINRGQGAALQTGITYSLREGAACIVTFDADGQHAVDDITRLIDPVLAGRYDIVLGSRFLGSAEGMPVSRWLQLKAAVLFTRIVSGVRLTDAHNGLRAFSRRAASAIELTIDRMGHASEVIDQIRGSGLPYTEVPVHIRYTDDSLAKGQRGLAALPILFDYLVRRLRK